MVEILKQAGFELLVFIVMAVTGIAAELVMTSKTIRPGVKTAFFLVLSQGIAAGLGLLGWKTWHNGNQTGGLVIWAVTAALSVVFLVGAVIGYRKGWKSRTDE